MAGTVLMFHFSQFRVEFYRKLEITTILSEKSIFGIFCYEFPENIRNIRRAKALVGSAKADPGANRKLADLGARTGANP